jgi:hypothetical protein
LSEGGQTVAVGEVYGGSCTLPAIYADLIQYEGVNLENARQHLCTVKQKATKKNQFLSSPLDDI